MNTVTNLLARARRRASRTALLACAATLLPCLAHAYSLPVRGDSLQVGERFSTFVHQAGTQALGKDINVVRRESDSSWPALKAGASDPTVLSNWLDYGKSVYAMAPGTIIACWRNSPQNTPGTMRSEVGVTISRAGNHLWVLQDDGVYALYAHMQPGSIPTALCPHNEQFMPNDAAAYTDPKKPDVAKPALVSRGAHISAGQKLGLLGNSGASGARAAPARPHGEGRPAGRDDLRPGHDGTAQERHLELRGALDAARRKGDADGHHPGLAAAPGRLLDFQGHAGRGVPGPVRPHGRLRRDAEHHHLHLGRRDLRHGLGALARAVGLLRRHELGRLRHQGPAAHGARLHEDLHLQLRDRRRRLEEVGSRPAAVARSGC